MREPARVSPPRTVATSRGRGAREPRSLPAPGPHPFTAPPSHRNSQPPPSFPSPQRPPPGINLEETGTSSPAIGSALEPGRHSGRQGRRPRPLRAPGRHRGLAPVHAEKPVALGVPRRCRARPPGLPGRTNPRASSAVPQKEARGDPGALSGYGVGTRRTAPALASQNEPEPRTPPRGPALAPVPPPRPSAPTARPTFRSPFSFGPPSVTDGEHGEPGGRSCAVRDSGQRREEQEAALRADGAKKDPRARRSRSYTISVST